MSSFKDVVGHKNIIKYIESAVQADAVSHAYILNGERGSGKKLLANLFAMSLQCQDRDENGEACGKCQSCKQALHGNQPDIIRVSHEKPTTISVDDIRQQVNNDIVIKPYSSKYKIYIIPEADLMSVQAQNALLKTIEEPPEYAVIMLLTENAEVLLPTIRSRCVMMKLRNIKDQLVKKYLMEQMEIPDYKADVCVAFAQGNMGKAIMLANSDYFNEIKEEVVHLLRNIDEMDVPELMDAVKKCMTYKLEINDYLDMMAIWYRDVLIYKATKNVDRVVFSDQLRYIKARASKSSYEGIEKGLIEAQKVPYYGISSGKLRRYFDVKNFSDPFKVIKGYYQSIRLLKKIKPDVVFSKGGFVSVPVVLAAKHCKIPAIIHESDITPGLANKLAIPSATKVCCNFPETMKYLPEGKAVLTGSPIRQELLNGNPSDAIKLCRFENTEKPVVLIIGGSTGSRAINTAIRDLLPELLKRYNIIHLCGKGNLDETLKDTDGYAQFEYANKELADMFALASLVISRAGANAICELLALHKPNILIPLSAAASRGDQILNANSFRSSGYSYVLEEEAVTNTALLEAIDHVFSHKERYVEAMEKSNGKNSIAAIVSLIDDAAKKN